MVGSLPGVVICAVGFAVSLGTGLSVRNSLSLEYKRNSPSFFVRNREEFAKHGVTALIGSIVGWLVGHFLK